MNLNIQENIRIKKMDFIIVMHNVNSVNIMYVFIKIYLFFGDYDFNYLIFKISVHCLMDTHKFTKQDMEI